MRKNRFWQRLCLIYYSFMSKKKHCVYCGDWYQCRDHIIPISYNQNYRNYKHGDTVSCCSICNLLAGDSVHFSIISKAKYLYQKYSKKYKKVLKFPKWTNQELIELDYSLSNIIIRRQHLKKLIILKLENLELVSNGFEPKILNSFKNHKEAFTE